MRERQKTDHGSAGVLLARAGEQRIEGPGIGSPRKEPITIDEIEQRQRFAAHGVDHVAIIDDVAMFAVRLWSPPLSGYILLLEIPGSRRVSTSYWVCLTFRAP